MAGTRQPTPRKTNSAASSRTSAARAGTSRAAIGKALPCSINASPSPICTSRTARNNAASPAASASVVAGMAAQERSSTRMGNASSTMPPPTASNTVGRRQRGGVPSPEHDRPDQETGANRQRWLRPGLLPHLSRAGLNQEQRRGEARGGKQQDAGQARHCQHGQSVEDQRGSEQSQRGKGAAQRAAEQQARSGRLGRPAGPVCLLQRHGPVVVLVHWCRAIAARRVPGACRYSR